MIILHQIFIISLQLNFPIAQFQLRAIILSTCEDVQVINLFFSIGLIINHKKLDELVYNSISQKLIRIKIYFWICRFVNLFCAALTTSLHLQVIPLALIFHRFCYDSLRYYFLNYSVNFLIYLQRLKITYYLFWLIKLKVYFVVVVRVILFSIFFVLQYSPFVIISLFFEHLWLYINHYDSLLF